MAISDRINKSMAQGSWIRKMFDEGAKLKQQYGEDNVFDLSLGNPIMEPPVEFSREFKKLANNPIPGMHRYMENAGYKETRAAVAAQLSADSGIKFTQEQVVMTCGAAGALNVVLRTILNPGEEVIVLAPFFAEYLSYIDNHGGIPRVIPTDESFLPSLNAIEGAIGPRTKAVLINSPNNPSGVVYSRDVIHQLGELLKRKRSADGGPIYLISDEPYRHIVYDGMECPQIWPHYEHSIVVNSHSKDLALPGERIGYAAINPACDRCQELVAGFIYCNRTLGFVNAPALMQRIVARLQNVSLPAAEYQKKRDFLYEHLIEMGYSLLKPQGAFYMFPKAPGGDDIAFVEALLEHRVLAVPGRGFGSPAYFRIAYCTDDKTLEDSLPGLKKAAAKFQTGGK